MTDFLESEYLKVSFLQYFVTTVTYELLSSVIVRNRGLDFQEQVESINKIAKYITILKRVGPGLGEYEFDRELLEEQAQNKSSGLQCSALKCSCMFASLFVFIDITDGVHLLSSFISFKFALLYL